jgi:hypothetical protein
LEKGFAFDEPKNPLPDLAELKSGTLPAVGKKEGSRTSQGGWQLLLSREEEEEQQQQKESSGSSLVESASDLLARSSFF